MNVSEAGRELYIIISHGNGVEQQRKISTRLPNWTRELKESKRKRRETLERSSHAGIIE